MAWRKMGELFQMGIIWEGLSEEVIFDHHHMPEVGALIIPVLQMRHLRLRGCLGLHS